MKTSSSTTKITAISECLCRKNGLFAAACGAAGSRLPLWGHLPNAQLPLGFPGQYRNLELLLAIRRTMHHFK
jgi:hypothetical protein